MSRFKSLFWVNERTADVNEGVVIIFV